MVFCNFRLCTREFIIIYECKKMLLRCLHNEKQVICVTIENPCSFSLLLILPRSMSMQHETLLLPPCSVHWVKQFFRILHANAVYFSVCILCMSRFFLFVGLLYTFGRISKCGNRKKITVPTFVTIL